MVVVGVLAVTGVASGEVAPRRAVANQTRTAKAPAGAPKKLSAPIDSAPPSAPMRGPAKPALAIKVEPVAPAPTASAVMMSYQRIGRDIIQLQSFRGTECTLELWKTFRAIKLEEATATTASRIATAATLQELSVRIDRKRGITIRQECLDNPLAPECQ